MISRTSRFVAVAAAGWLAAAFAIAVPAFAQTPGSGFVTVKSEHNYPDTVNALQHSIKSNGLMVMGRVNQKAILSMTGLHLAGAESFLIGNPRVGKKLFSMNPAVAAVVPARISVWVSNGTTYVGYFKPSSQLSALSSQLAKPGEMLDMKFEKIVQQATR